MMKTKLMTFIFVAHENFDENIDYLNQLFKKMDEITGDFELIYLFDNTLTNFQIENLRKFLNPSIKAYWNYNVGKLKAIISIADKLNSRFIKIVDHDDVINYLEINSLFKSLRKINDNIKTFVEHTACKIYENNKLYGDKIIEENILRNLKKECADVRYCNVPNAKSIFEKDFFIFLKEINNKINRMDFFDDNFLSDAAILWSEKKIKIKTNIYVQYHAFGQTSKSNTNSNLYYDLQMHYKNLLVVKENLINPSISKISSKKRKMNNIKHHLASQDTKNEDVKFLSLYKLLNSIYD